MAENETTNPEVPEMPETENEEKVENPMEQFFYHQRRALEETAKALDALLPPGFKEHSSEAGKEFAKGFKVLVDAAIDEMKKVSEKEDLQDEDGEDDDRPSTTGKTKVKVQVD